MVFRDPTAEDLVRECEMTRFVMDFQEDVLAEIFERRLRTETGIGRPLLELRVVSNARSRVIASYCVRPGDLWLLEGSLPSRCVITSVVRFNPETLLTPAT